MDILAGVIDYGYSGLVGVLMYNNNSTDVDFKVEPGMIVCQAIVELALIPAVKQVHTVEKTARGEGEFGCTEERNAQRAKTT
jgi:dUTPase